MLNRRLHTFAAAAALGMALAIPPQGRADDTDIYKAPAGANQDIIKPNVLMILDTSDSMNQKVPLTGPDPSVGATADDNSRLDEMRTAMVGLLQSLDNINVGLMRFNGHRNPTNPDAVAGLSYIGTGGPVLFPVKDLDASVFTVAGEAGSGDLTIFVQVDASTDDAEEILDGTVLLTDSNLNLGTRADEEVTVFVAASTDDGYETTTGAGLILEPADGSRFNRVVLARDDFIGLRFPDIPIPKDAQIKEADLSFVAVFDQNDTGADVTISGILLDAGADVPTFTNAFKFSTYGALLSAATVGWDIPEWDPNEAYTANTTSPDLASIVEELVKQASWVEGKPIGFQLNDDTPGSDPGNSRRAGKSFDHADQTAGGQVSPRFRAIWVRDDEPQQVGIRFDDVQIPQGATITSAFIDFIAKDPTVAEQVTPTSLDIAVHDVANSGTFTDTADASATPGESETIDERTWLLGAPVFVPPTIPDPDPLATTDDFPITSSDLKTLVQHIVDKPFTGDPDLGWCGGNAMTFRLTGTGRTVVHSFDSDPTKAPVLRVTFDQSALGTGEGCIERSLVFQTGHAKDDAEERLDNNAVALNAPLRLANIKPGGVAVAREVAVQFPEVDLSPGTDVLSAVIEFTSKVAKAGAIGLTITGETTAGVLRYSNGAGNLTDRARTTAAVAWSPPDLAAAEVVTTPDLSAVVEEIIASGGNWTNSPPGAMGFFLTHVSGTNFRVVHSYNTSVINSPRLKLRVREILSAGAGAKTVRDRLVEIVDQQIFTLNRTPTIETLYEAALYWRGDNMHYGKSRCCSLDPPPAPANNKMRNARVSHPGSYSGGTLNRLTGCDDADLAAVECISENVSGTPVYNTPFANQECQNNFMIFLSDGAPTQNAAEDLIESNILGVQCVTDNFKGQNGRCGKDLLAHMATVDQDPDRSGDQLITTYTIGFNLGAGNNTVEFMEELAVAGGGTFTEATNAASLTAEMEQIFDDILNRTTSFASPALSVNAFNKLFTRDVVYFALFRPDTRVRWNGNIKKFQICSDPDVQVCDLGELIDQNGVVAIDDDNRILSTATSIWTTGGVEDGAEIETGGAGDAVPVFDNEQRILYTDAGLADNPTSAVDLGTDHKMEFESEQYKSAAAFRDDACSGLSDDDCDALMLWMLGKFELNEDDTQRVSPNDASRWGIPDPLHSSPLVITYGVDGGDPTVADPVAIDKLFVGTNDGSLHMLNADDGTVEWSFVASEMLEVQETLATNSDQSDIHIYGLDLTPSIRIEDLNNDGVIDPDAGDFVHLYIGMRRGGSSLYALDVTPADPIENNDPGLIVPKFLWRITGGGADDFVRLGETWSKPVVTDISVGASGTAKTVLLMGGGYDNLLDEGFGTAATLDEPNIGNAIYIIDPDEGVDADDRVIFWMTQDDDDASTLGDEKVDVIPDPDLKVPNMKFSIVSDLATFDSTGDGLTNRIYVGDMGGQVWRVDLGPTLDVGDRGGTIVGRLADLSIAREDTTDPTDLPLALVDERRFMNPPTVVQVRDFEFTETGSQRYDMVALASGNRTDPLNTDVLNRIYAIRDLHPGGMEDTSPIGGDGLADDYPVTGGTARDNDDLVDVTENLIQDGTDDQIADAKTALKAGFGWYIDLESSGEKGLASPVVLAGKMFVTTFLPEANQDPCTAAEGEGQLYGVNILSGAAELNWDETSDTLNKADRILVLGSGIPSGAVPVFQEAGITLLIGTGGGAASVDPLVALPRQRTYWFQQDI